MWRGPQKNTLGYFLPLISSPPPPSQMLSSGCSGMREEIYLKGLSMLVDTYCQMQEYTKVEAAS